MRKFLRILAVSVAVGLLISLVVTVHHAVRGRYVAIDRTEYLFRGDVYCDGLGYIDPDASAEWLRVRYQCIEEDGGVFHLAYDWKEIASNFLILSGFFSLLFLPFYVLLVRKLITNRK